MVATNPVFFVTIKNSVRSDQEFNNLETDMITRNPEFATHQKGAIDARIAVYAERYPSMLGVHLSPSVHRSVRIQCELVIQPDVPMADAHNQSTDSEDKDQADDINLLPGRRLERRAKRREKRKFDKYAKKRRDSASDGPSSKYSPDSSH